MCNVMTDERLTIVVSSRRNGSHAGTFLFIKNWDSIGHTIHGRQTDIIVTIIILDYGTIILQYL